MANGVADHMAAMLRAQRERADGLLAAGRATAGLAARVQDAVLALFRSTDPADCVSGEMPGILAVDAAHLCVEAEHPGARRLPDGASRRLLDGRQVVFRDAPADARLLHAEAAGLARHDALIRVPGEGPARPAGPAGARPAYARSGAGCPARSASSAVPWPPHSAADGRPGIASATSPAQRARWIGRA